MLVLQHKSLPYPLSGRAQRLQITQTLAALRLHRAQVIMLRSACHGQQRNVWYQYFFKKTTMHVLKCFVGMV